MNTDMQRLLFLMKWSISNQVNITGWMVWMAELALVTLYKLLCLLTQAQNKAPLIYFNGKLYIREASSGFCVVEKTFLGIFPQTRGVWTCGAIQWESPVTERTSAHTFFEIPTAFLWASGSQVLAFNLTRNVYLQALTSGRVCQTVSNKLIWNAKSFNNFWRPEEG